MGTSDRLQACLDALRAELESAGGDAGRLVEEARAALAAPAPADRDPSAAIELGLLAAEAGEATIARELLETALVRPGTDGALAAAGGVCLARLLLAEAEPEAAWRACRDVMRRLQVRNAELAEAPVVHNAAAVAFGCRRFLAASVWWARSRALFQQGGDSCQLASSEHNLAIALQERGKLEPARDHFRAARALWRAIGERDNLAETLQGLGEVCEATGLCEESVACFLEALEITVQTQLHSGIAESLEGVAAGLAGLGEPIDATYALGVARRLREEFGCALPADHLPELEGRIEALRASLGPDAFARAFAQGERDSGAGALVRLAGRAARPSQPAASRW